jgi:hypothetical protein
VENRGEYVQICQSAVCKIVPVEIFIAHRYPQIEYGRRGKESRFRRKQGTVPSLKFAIEQFELKQIHPRGDNSWERADDRIDKPPQLHMFAGLNVLRVDEIIPLESCVLKSVDKWF